MSTARAGLEAILDARAPESIVTTRSPPVSNPALQVNNTQNIGGRLGICCKLEFTTETMGGEGCVAYLDGGGNRIGLRTWGLTAVLDDSSGRSRGLLARFVGLGHGDSSSQGPTP